MEKEKVSISIAGIADLKDILHLQKQAFITEAESHGNYDIEPLRQTYESILSDFNSCLFLKAVSGGKIIGSVKYKALDDRVWIGKLMVDTGYRGQGLGRRLLAEVEKANPDAKKFQLFTAASALIIYVYMNPSGIKFAGSIKMTGKPAFLWWKWKS